ncbi:Non-structural protein C [Singulisphaera sp. GP187]|uniref:hypothetical protein n=1 Tax=Singulisphaera sp. GP187 TaxID=1882752 RepID=UPI00092A3469|nr:hypothetical protein [Singulisphaera sp. GP187]SIO67227.1 Non-structural protein C [Singulisphaera sp. GP187]
MVDRARIPSAANFFANVLALYPARWLSTAIEGVEPTKNHAEQLLRLGVLWQKNDFSCHSAVGYRLVERMLTVVQTLRLQKLPVLDYLNRATMAHRAEHPALQLLGQTRDCTATTFDSLEFTVLGNASAPTG